MRLSAIAFLARLAPSECPSNVNLALLKAELMHARHRRDGLPLRERILSNVDLLGRLGCLLPALANAILDSPMIRRLMRKAVGLTDKRPLPHYAKQRFDYWFRDRQVGTPRSGVRSAAARRPCQSRRGHPLGRHFCPVSRTAHRYRRGQSARSAWIQRLFGERAKMLWTSRL